jgi:hypothetical protein
VRDLVVKETLRDLATEAADRFRELLRSGTELPYEVREPGDGSPFCHYTPLTATFIRDHSTAITSLASFGPAASALLAAEIARPYLAQFGIESTGEQARDAEDAVIAFLCRLWSDSTDFSLEPGRVDAALSELDAAGDADASEVEVVVPVIGLRMPVSRLELATASLIRADVVDVPTEARDPAGSGRAGYEPHFLAYARCSLEELLPSGEEDAGAGAPVAGRFHSLVTALRLFKPGGVGLGPHGWTRTGGGRWRRISTGAARPRPGAYVLADGELGGLAAFSRALERRPVRVSALSRAISRFEVGLERRSPAEALNDYLLSVRFLLEGGGPAATGLPMRVAALCAEPGDRQEVKLTLDRALALERELWSGDPAPADDARSPLEIAAEVEDFARAILKDAACGHLGGDLRATADEILLADGLAAGEGAASQRGETTEWEPDDAPADAAGDTQEVEPSLADGAAEPQAAATPPAEAPSEPLEAEAEDPRGQRAWTFDPPTAPSSSPAAPSEEPEKMQESVPPRQSRERMVERSQAQAEDWLAESGEPGDTLDFPERPPALRLLDQRPEERAAIRQRVSTLFPRPEPTEWSVGELDYDRTRRARIRA